MDKKYVPETKGPTYHNLSFYGPPTLLDVHLSHCLTAGQCGKCFHTALSPDARRFATSGDLLFDSTFDFTRKSRSGFLLRALLSDKHNHIWDNVEVFNATMKHILQHILSDALLIACLRQKICPWVLQGRPSHFTKRLKRASTSRKLAHQRPGQRCVPKCASGFAPNPLVASKSAISFPEHTLFDSGSSLATER